MSGVAVDDVLAQWDQAAEDFRFPDLGHVCSYLVDARLRLYADPGRWAMVVDIVGYNPRSGNLVDVVHVFGNCLTIGTPGYENDDFIERVDNWEAVESPEDPETYAGEAQIVIRGKALTVTAQAGDDLADVFRGLVPTHRDLLLADEVEARRRIPGDIPLVLQLDEWNQLDPAEVPPSRTETFRMLAEVAATGDPAHYAPTSQPTTHWSHWPESGSM